MKHFPKRKSAGACALAFIGIAVLASAPTVAQETTAEWQFAATVYAWLPDISGNTNFPTSDGGSFGVDIGTILDHLQMTGQAAFEVQKGHWGAYTDVVYMDVGASKSRTRDLTIDGHELPLGVTAKVNLDSKSTIWTLGGSYRVLSGPDVTFDVLAGARLLDIKQDLEWELSGDFGETSSPPLTGRRDESASHWDAIVGVKGRYVFGADSAWSVPYYFDLGTGDSDFTWQGSLGLAYSFGWGDLGVTWRYMDYEMNPGKAIDNVNFNGPALGATFRW